MVQPARAPLAPAAHLIAKEVDMVSNLGKLTRFLSTPAAPRRRPQTSGPAVSSQEAERVRNEVERNGRAVLTDCNGNRFLVERSEQ